MLMTKPRTKGIEVSSGTVSISSNTSTDSLENFLLGGDAPKKATYKIEIEYLEARRNNAPTPVAVQVWESGSKLHGGGDQSVFWCLDGRKNGTGEGCGGIIPSSNMKGEVGVCPNCNKGVVTNYLPVKRIGVFSNKALAKELEKIYIGLKFDADIYLKHYIVPTGTMHFEKAKGKKTKVAAIYTLDRIIKDTSNGKSLRSCIEGFLEA